jgi:hypothetical protein
MTRSRSRFGAHLVPPATRFWRIGSIAPPVGEGVLAIRDRALAEANNWSDNGYGARLVLNTDRC